MTQYRSFLIVFDNLPTGEPPPMGSDEPLQITHREYVHLRVLGLVYAKGSGAHRVVARPLPDVYAKIVTALTTLAIDPTHQVGDP